MRYVVLKDFKMIVVGWRGDVPAQRQVLEARKRIIEDTPEIVAAKLVPPLREEVEQTT